MFKLKKIELLGFKSFADRTRLEFGEGTVGIVGPNGCGKSNISDAISWVLGEQSAKSLRGERMADVIFNGTSKRPPTGMAEANITLVDPEYVDPPRESPSSSLALTPSGDTESSETELAANVLPGLQSENHPDAPQSREQAARPAGLHHRAGEITVTRRLFRSGESEYLINGEVSRRRDIQDLFMGTGLGPESYAIIEQGRIGQILSSKPSDRRAIIEEAAGVSKFKTRKRLAEAKLESSRQNLARVTDILLEVTKQMNSLKRQAGKARRYRELSADLRERQKRVLVSRLFALEEECCRLQEKTSLARDECSAVARSLEALEAEEKAARSHSESVESELIRLRRLLADQELERERLNSRMEQGQKQLAGLATRIAEAGAESAEFREQLAGFEQQGAEKASQLVQVRQDWTTAQIVASSLLEEQKGLADDLIRQEEQLESGRQELLVAVSRAADLRNQLAKAEEMSLALERQISRLTSERAGIEQNLTELTAECQAFGLDHEREAGDLARLAQSAAETSEALEQAHKGASRQQNDIASLGREFSAARARKEALEETLAHHAYSTATVQRLLSSPIPVNAHHFRPLGVLADFLEVAPGYEEVVEDFLKEALDYVVVEEREEARSAIAMLKSEGAGRSTFFVTRLTSNGHGNGNGNHSRTTPLTQPGEHDPTSFELSQKELEPAQLALGLPISPLSSSEPGVVFRDGQPGPAAGSNDFAATGGVLAPLTELVTLLPTLGINGGVAFPLLANTYVVEDSATAERLAALYPERHFLTRSGEHYHHRLVAGGRGPSAGPLALRRDLRELERRTSDLQLKLERSQESARKLSEEVAALERELRKLNAAKLEAEKKTLIADEKVKQLRQALERATAQRNIVDRELANVEHERQQIETRQSHLHAEITLASEEQARRETGISQMAELVRQSRTRLDHVRQQLIGAQARCSALEERIRSLEGERATLSARVEEFGKKLKRVAEQCAAWDREQQQVAAETEQGRARLTELESEQNSAEGHLQGLEQETISARQRISQVAPLIESARKALDEARERRSQAEIALARAESDLAHAARQCEQELDSKPDIIRAEFPPDLVVQGEALHEAEQELAELKARIEALGPVNMMALEELQEAEERYRFLEGQRQDLLASIDDTAQAIREIDQVSRQQFLEAFAAINRYFAECFRILFAGGNGELRLSDESDPEGGIDMAAQPPGKRLQNVLLLSGGEKALAALALLIGMFRYTPSPFCILDEVDAPLDESNVDRFTRLISDMSTHTQFILITHNKRTMEIAKALYGVTMEEPGISKLVSVRMGDIAA